MDKSTLTDEQRIANARKHIQKQRNRIETLKRLIAYQVNRGRQFKEIIRRGY
jgi:hypothetical protein